MGTCLSQVDPDSESTGDFVQFGDRDEDGRPQRKRKCTDIFFLYFFGTFLAITCAFLIYCASIGDVNRILTGYDNCGNVCGEQNKRDGNDVGCVGLDMTSKPFMLERSNERICVTNCEQYGYDTIFGRCVPRAGGDVAKAKPFWQNLTEDINASKLEIFYMALISFALVCLTVMLMRYNTEPFIWSILVGGAVAMTLGCVAIWVLRSTATKREERDMLMSLGIFFTVLTVILLLCLLVMFKRIKLVVSLFKEASKAIGAIPHILLEPVATIAAFFISFVVIVYGGILIGSAGNLQMIHEGLYEYVPNKAVIFTGVIFTVGWIWMLYFFVGCQNMIVGGTISSWYFIRDKSRLASPILYATHNLLRYHLGTVAFGSFIMLIMQLIRMLIESLKRRAQNGCGLCLICCSCIFNILEEFVRYFSKLAFIVTSMHGVPFCKGGKNAMRLIVDNGLATIALNSVGSFILFFINLTIMLTTMLIGYYMMDKPGLHSVWGPLVVSTLIAFFMAYCVLSVYDTTLDTIFLCFCEDCEINDGLSRPYYMSAELMIFVENSKKALEQLEANKTQPKTEEPRDAWNSTTPAHPA
ncbi:LOW QUALITY PROTEIN: choline transporter-like protein 1 [Atheta coriaria]|uniref:LOW QUALITY PROTEIN: choline transporter-like protein 1 n=1 Tax=Dalotia coriaria TaxID=877792 RepID=UPI0031F433A7